MSCSCSQSAAELRSTAVHERGLSRKLLALPATKSTTRVKEPPSMVKRATSSRRLRCQPTGPPFRDVLLNFCKLVGLQPAFGGPVSYKKCVQILIFVVTIEGPFLIFVVDSSCIFPASLARPPKKEGFLYYTQQQWQFAWRSDDCPELIRRFVCFVQLHHACTTM